jgi:hypothetical protein
MPRFYFHLRNDMDVPDNEGKELRNLEEAVAYALNLTRFEAAELVKENGRIVLSHRIDIEDEQHIVLETVHFSDVVKVEA